MKEFFAEHKSDIKKIIYLIIALIVIALLTAVVLMLLDVVYFDQGIKLNVELFSAYSKSFVGVLYYLLLQCIVTVLLCALPGTSLTFIMLSTVVFDKPYVAFYFVVPFPFIVFVYKIRPFFSIGYSFF